MICRIVYNAYAESAQLWCLFMQLTDSNAYNFCLYIDNLHFFTFIMHIFILYTGNTLLVIVMLHMWKLMPPLICWPSQMHPNELMQMTPIILIQCGIQRNAQLLVLFKIHASLSTESHHPSLKWGMITLWCNRFPKK